MLMKRNNRKTKKGGYNIFYRIYYTVKINNEYF